MRKIIVLYIALATSKAQGTEKIKEPLSFETEVDLPSKNIKGRITYTITPDLSSAGEQEKTIPILIKRRYDQPKLQDEVMVGFPESRDAEPFGKLVKASETHLKDSEELFFTLNGGGNSELIKKTWKDREDRKDKKRMLIYYRENKNQEWKIIGEAGLNGYYHQGNKKEIFYWKGVQSHLTGTLGIKEANLKGIMSTAVTGLISYLFATTSLESVLAYTDTQNASSRKMLSNIGFTDTENQQPYGNNKYYAIYEFTKVDFKNKYQHMTIAQYNQTYHPQQDELSVQSDNDKSDISSQKSDSDSKQEPLLEDTTHKEDDKNETNRSDSHTLFNGCLTIFFLFIISSGLYLLKLKGKKNTSKQRLRRSPHSKKHTVY